jgi:hypothetical protein
LTCFFIEGAEAARSSARGQEEVVRKGRAIVFLSVLFAGALFAPPTASPCRITSVAPSFLEIYFRMERSRADPEAFVLGTPRNWLELPEDASVRSVLDRLAAFTDDCSTGKEGGASAFAVDLGEDRGSVSLVHRPPEITFRPDLGGAFTIDYSVMELEAPEVRLEVGDDTLDVHVLDATRGVALRIRLDAISPRMETVRANVFAEPGKLPPLTDEQELELQAWLDALRAVPMPAWAENRASGPVGRAFLDSLNLANEKLQSLLPAEIDELGAERRDYRTVNRKLFDVAIDAYGEAGEVLVEELTFFRSLVPRGRRALFDRLSRPVVVGFLLRPYAVDLPGALEELDALRGRFRTGRRQLDEFARVHNLVEELSFLWSRWRVVP